MAGNVMEGTDWLKSLSRFGVKPGLERTRRVLEAFGNPQDEFHFLHVAGTNGKGSVCAYLTALLADTMTVGTFTSPAFDGYRGRFMVDGDTISTDRFGELANEVRKVVVRVTPDNPLTEFEVLTVMAILHFQAQHVETVVWETGLGGRFDSTNVVSPLVTAITNVSYDHMNILGSTLAAIAYDKAGIIKPGVPVITAAVDEAYTVIKRVAHEMGASLYQMRTHFAGTRQSVKADVQTMTYRGMKRDIASVPVPLFGAHQCENAAVALAMYEAASIEAGWKMKDDTALQGAMLQTRWPGRFEIHHKNGWPIIFDGAHNADGAARFAESIQEFDKLEFENFSAGDRPKWTFVIGVLADKEVGRMLSAVLPFAGRIIATSPENARALGAGELANAIHKFAPDLDVQAIASVDAAMKEALRNPTPIACLGSLYTVDEARKAMENDPQ